MKKKIDLQQIYFAVDKKAKKVVYFTTTGNIKNALNATLRGLNEDPNTFKNYEIKNVISSLQKHLTIEDLQRFADTDVNVFYRTKFLFQLLYTYNLKLRNYKPINKQIGTIQLLNEVQLSLIDETSKLEKALLGVAPLGWAF